MRISLQTYLNDVAKLIVYPLKSRLVRPKDSILEILSDALAKGRVRLRDKDVVAVSSKIVAISEGRIRNVEAVEPSREARDLARKFSMTPQFVQTVLDEADEVVGGVKGTLLTIKGGDAVPNAGADRKNAPDNSVVLWPANPDSTAKSIRNQITKQFRRNVGVVIVDSRVSPLRLGTTGFAIGSSGFDPVEDIRGMTDLSGRRVQITVRAVADGLAATAQLVMGEASERVPFAIIRGASVHSSRNGGVRRAKLSWNRCLYMSQIKRPSQTSRTTHPTV